MKIEVRRFKFNENCTIGMMLLDGQFFCFTLEDMVRSGPKIKGVTAIPAGKYKVVVNRSPKFGRDLPLLLDVPGFGGIRIHRGNNASHTLGCILVGNDYMENSLKDSTPAETALVKKLKAVPAIEDIYIDITHEASGYPA